MKQRMMWLKYTFDTNKDDLHWFMINAKELLHEDGTFKCFHCSGSGSMYDPDDPPDCYEGNKLRNRIACDKCHGTGTGDKEFYILLFHKNLQRYEDEKEAERRDKLELAAIEKLIRSVLSPSQMKRVKLS